MRVAFQGVPGAFSHEAALAMVPGCEPAPFPSFDAAFAAVQSGDCARAAIPVENSLAGPVPEVARLLPASGLVVVAEVWRRIEIALLAVPGAALADLRRVRSHPMALKQCRATLERMGLAPVEAFDTAGAAREVAEAGDPATAAAAAATAGRLNGLAIMRANLEDRDDNRTRFLLLETKDLAAQA